MLSNCNSFRQEKMNNKVIKFLFGIFLVFHLSVACLCVFRKDLPSFLSRLSILYCSPLFHQNWQLFAPDVAVYQTELQLKLRDEEGKFIYKNVSEFFGYKSGGIMKRIEYNIATDLAWDYTQMVYFKDGIPQFESLRKTRSYNKAIYLVHSYFRNAGMEIDTLNMRLAIHFISSPDSIRNSSEQYIELPTFIRSI